MRDDLSFAQKLSIPITAAAARQIVIRKREDKRNKIQEQVSQIIQKLIENAEFSGDEDSLSILRVDSSIIEYWDNVQLELKNLGYKVSRYSGAHFYILLPRN